MEIDSTLRVGLSPAPVPPPHTHTLPLPLSSLSWPDLPITRGVRAEPDTGARRQQFCSPVRDSANPVEQSLRNKLANIALFWCGTPHPRSLWRGNIFASVLAFCEQVYLGGGRQLPARR